MASTATTTQDFGRAMDSQPLDQVARLALADVVENAELNALVVHLADVQRAQERNGEWDTPTGHRTERVLGLLRMALETAGTDPRFLP